MDHLTPTQLHEIEYGFRPSSPHLGECADCRGILEAIRAEGDSLREILQGGAVAAAAQPVRSPDRYRLWRQVVGVAAAAGFLAVLIYVLFGSSPSRFPAGDRDVEKTFRRIEEKIANAATLKIRFRRESPPHQIGSGELVLGDNNRLRFVIRRPIDSVPGINDPPGVDDEYLTISDGRQVINLARHFGGISIEDKVDALSDLKMRVAKGVARCGLRYAEVVMPGASEPLEATHWLWKYGEAYQFKAEPDDGDCKVLSYRVSGGSEGGQFKLWYDPKSLIPRKREVRNSDRDTDLEFYEEFSVGSPVPDGDFAFPPGKDDIDLQQPRAPLADIQELARGGKVQEVWVEQGEIVVHLADPIERKGKRLRQWYVEVPRDSFKSPDALQRLFEGVRPDRFHVARNYKPRD